jgi:inner membrane protein
VALALGSLIGLAVSRVGGRGLRMGVFASLVLVSHPLLDMLTDGGLGCAWLWPFDSQRAFAPWSPIPAAPIGKAFWSPAGLRVFVAELVLFSPLLLFAFWPRSRAGGE